MIPAEWVRYNEKELSAEQVKRLDPGDKVIRISADRYGESYRVEYTVVQSGKKKVLTTRNPLSGEKIVKPIKANDNCRYVVARGVIA